MKLTHIVPENNVVRGNFPEKPHRELHPSKLTEMRQLQEAILKTIIRLEWDTRDDKETVWEDFNELILPDALEGVRKEFFKREHPNNTDPE